jgi:hypothetical protein
MATDGLPSDPYARASGRAAVLERFDIPRQTSPLSWGQDGRRLLMILVSRWAAAN